MSRQKSFEQFVLIAVALLIPSYCLANTNIITSQIQPQQQQQQQQQLIPQQQSVGQIEKREGGGGGGGGGGGPPPGPPGGGPGGPMMDQGSYGQSYSQPAYPPPQQQQYGGSYGASYSGGGYGGAPAAPPAPYGGSGGYSMASYGQGDQGYGQVQNMQYGGGGGPPPQFGGGDPGFSVQTGFEGFLVPNSWYGLLPWGVEGVVIACAGLVVFAVVAVGIGALLVWVCGFGDFSAVREQARGLLPEMSMETLTSLSNTVLDSVDRYNELFLQSNENTNTNNKQD